MTRLRVTSIPKPYNCLYSLRQSRRLRIIDRMIDICGRPNMEVVLASYNHFLERFESADVRQRLKELGRHERGDPLFRELKNEGHHLTRELLKLFEATFDSTHPIRRAVVF